LDLNMYDFEAKGVESQGYEDGSVKKEKVVWK
jgi:hypothetical protein